MATTLHVVLYHPARLPVADYGGTERVVVWLARGLTERGHRVTLIAGQGTVVPEARVVEIDRRDAGRPGGPDLTPYLPADADVLHAHTPLHIAPRGVPFLWTYHGFGLLVGPPAGVAVGLSADHAARHGLQHWVHNGLDPDEYEFSARKGSADLFLGRLHSVKGWQWAVEGARRSGHSLDIVGGWRPTLRRGLRYHGRLGGARKAAFLVQAACLWMPARWDEPFGLTTIEAMVSGTPVLGTRRGALPEIVTGNSGRLGDTLDELVALRREVSDLDPEAIRARVLQQFTHRTMAEHYERVYREVIGDSNQPATGRTPRG